MTMTATEREYMKDSVMLVNLNEQNQDLKQLSVVSTFGPAKKGIFAFFIVAKKCN